MSKSLVALAAAAVLALAGCSTEASPETSTAQDAVVQQLGFTGKTPQEIVQAIDSSLDARPLDFAASVRGSQLVLATDQQETTLTLPGDKFYLSLAPYQTRTHECYNHSLATCRGELADADVTVKFIDDQGKVVVDEQTTTYANGFVGFWLPRDIKGTVTVTHAGLTGTAPFATTEDSPTCMTTLRLTDKS
jgi:hypothetical protein